MEDPMNRHPGFDVRSHEGRAYVAMGIWLRVSLVGAVTAATGSVEWFAGELRPVPALALVAGGALLAEIGRRRTIAALGASAPAVVTSVPPPSPLDVRAALGR